MGRSQRDSEKRGEKRAWSEEVMKENPYYNPEKRDWYVEQLTTARPRSKNDTIVRLAGDRRQSELQKRRNFR